ncbi:MAG: hypothetical protein CO093_01170 [Alphaproteobacteria bacterium CG_4_9_14_3_um_filter_47_13]|nr:MAG: hypothetical protein CO093_01170 [Alphaproteobacteria bacterium CG_4_9_14_3_um_filter_47_13]
MTFTTAFGIIAFLNPWVLAGLVFLPALWFLLRVTPPAPHLVVFPAARFVAGLIPEESTTSRTPWWILLLRLIILALVILALARPVLNPVATLPGGNPIRIIMDNGWASAQSWNLQMEEAKRLLSSAGHDKRDIYILTTAPEPGSENPASHGPLTQAQADSILRGLTPHPWPADYKATLKLAQEQTPDKKLQSYWLSHGLKEGSNELFETLQAQGSLDYFRPGYSQLPLLLRPATKITQKLSVLVSAPKELPSGTPVTVNALGMDGRILGSQSATLNPREKSAEITIDIPDSVRNQVQQIQLSGRKGAGAVLLLDDQFKRRDVGIATANGNSEVAPLIEEEYYLKRALEPYANLSFGTIQKLINEKPAVIILPNIGAMPPEELNILEKWVKKGGLLLRFAGPNMTQGDNFLVPVPLLKGDRALGGALTWDKPVRLAPFSGSSPFYGLTLPEDITVKQQLLAEPVQGLVEKTWASLEDGTPLITADYLENGLIVLIHTTATPSWSDLSLSGLYIQILRRIINLAGSSAPATSVSGTLQPLVILDGFGAAGQPKGSVQPIPSSDFDSLIPDSSRPPGLYGRSGYQKSLNIGDRIGVPELFSSLPAGVATGHYGGQNENNLMPWILALAFFFFMLDWLIMVLMQINWRIFRPAVLLYLIFLSFSGTASAQTEAQMIEYADNIHLAYIKTGNIALDQTAQEGLKALSQTLTNRTSVEPSEVIALDPEQELSFFPLIYWPVAQEQKPLSTKALQNIQYYIDHGGTILFDTRDYISSANSGYSQGGRNAEKLRALIGSLNIPPLTKISDDHVLTKTFYLLNGFPGRYNGDSLWVEEQGAIGRDGVSSVIIGSNDWASAWAASSSTGARQEEESLRFGVNLVLYALTGNYKTDQVHLPHILERLGK